MRNYSLLKHALRTTVGAALACGLFSGAAAQNWPERPITLVLPQPAGGGVDTVSRMWADFASRKLGQPVVVDNKPGAGGAIAVQHVVHQPNDGYTVLAAGVSQMVLNKFTYKSLAYNPDKDLRGVAMLTTNPFLLVASPASGIRSLADLLREAKAHPQGLSFGSAGQGNSTHLVVEMLQQRTGIKMTHVPYKGEAAALGDVMGGHLQVMAPVLSTGVKAAQAGKVVPLMVLGAQRSADLPNVPSSNELGIKGFENIGWMGLAVRAGTPDAVVNRLHAISQEFLADPASQQRLQKMQVELMPGPANALEGFIAADTKRWAEATKSLKLAAD
ncbi:Bug family tripartite tricarboxylate transporter substrate binding protein [Polaromonas jejuensis]|uniref:Bug family tripartite tricarboxylate transporter substrate binding protein n=1 Tax=Polaromonas jejuensis TaxID=457502 RepID=A0ABW0QH26_9BURK|nr:tripartite tricarboxylate transporter substrate binding protein [Polaromonas jejuensis]